MADAPSQPEDFLATLTSALDPSAAVVSPPPPPPVSVPEMAPQPVPAARTDLLGGFVAPTAPPPVPAARVDLLGGLTAPASAPYMPAGAVDLLGGFGGAPASGPSTAHGVEYVYHEKQLSALCGVHTLNNLCQGPQFGAGDLAELALSLDAREVELLTSPGGHLDRAAASQHIDQHSGDFSVEVLKAALAQLGCRLVNAEHAEVVERLAEAPEAEEGYLMHRSSHWFALRPLAGIWWNLDSRLARPRRLSAAALRELVTRLRVDGGTVHVVQQLPPPAVHNAGHAGREQVLHPVEYLLTSTEPELLRGADADAADDADAALAAALEAEEAEAAAFGGSDPDAALAAALQREEEEAAAAAAAVAEAERARRAERSWLPSFGSTREPAAGSAAAGAAAGAASGAAPPPAGGEWLGRMGRMIGDGFDQLAGSMRGPSAASRAAEPMAPAPGERPRLDALAPGAPPPLPTAPATVVASPLVSSQPFDLPTAPVVGAYPGARPPLVSAAAAAPPPPRVPDLMQLGFDFEAVHRALEAAGGDASLAHEFLVAESFAGGGYPGAATTPAAAVPQRVPPPRPIVATPVAAAPVAAAPVVAPARAPFAAAPHPIADVD